MKPRERLLSLGPGMLSDHELLQILLSPGNGRISGEALSSEVLKTYGDVANLGQRRAGELAKLPGMGLAKACRTVAALELGKRAMFVLGDRPILTKPKQVYMTVIDLVSRENEECVLLTVNTKNRMIARYRLAEGSENNCTLTPHKVFSLILKEGASRFFLVHNHPSGDPSPSMADTSLTKRLLWGAEILGLHMLDHVIVAGRTYCSLRSDYPDLGVWG